MKGSAYVYFAILVILFVFIMLYNIFTEPMTEIDSSMRSYINDTNSSLASEALNTIDTINNVWVYWPLFLILALFIWMVVASQRREPMYYE